MQQRCCMEWRLLNSKNYREAERRESCVLTSALRDAIAHNPKLKRYSNFCLYLDIFKFSPLYTFFRPIMDNLHGIR